MLYPTTPSHQHNTGTNNSQYQSHIINTTQAKIYNIHPREGPPSLLDDDTRDTRPHKIRIYHTHYYTRRSMPKIEDDIIKFVYIDAKVI